MAPTGTQAAAEIAELLAELLRCSRTAIRLRTGAAAEGYDFSVSAPGHQFLVEYKSVASAGPLAHAIARLQQAAAAHPDGGPPLLVVPFMGPAGQKLCESSGVSWLDLSGNANIVAPGLRIWIDGRPNKYVDRGRPPSAFAPKSSRVARQLLLKTKQYQTQAELARGTELGDGFVSKIVRRLVQDHYLDRDDNGAVRPRDPNLLLAGWQGAYDFHRHNIVKGRTPARSSDDLLNQVAKELSRKKMKYAATGSTAASLYVQAATPQLVTFYLPLVPSRSWLSGIGFIEDAEGANLWLVVPRDEGVFHGGQTQGGIPCVSAVQAYLDLQVQSRGANDAAINLRKKLWGPNKK